jgi:hypothetical protein
VPVDGVLADEEPLRNRLIVEAGRDQPKNLDLSWRQALPVFGAGRRAQRSSSGHRAPRGRERSPDWRREVSDRRWRAGLRRGGFGTPERSHHPGELHARATGLERRAALLEQIDRIFQMLSRRLRIARSRRHETCREAGRRPQAVPSAPHRRWRGARRPPAWLRPCGPARQARTISSSAAARSVRFFAGRRRRCRSARSAPA